MSNFIYNHENMGTYMTHFGLLFVDNPVIITCNRETFIQDFLDIMNPLIQNF